jgi:hypothetical protein
MRLCDIAAKMHCSPDSVQRYVDYGLSTESIFPSSLTPEAVSRMRVLEAEKLATSTERVVTAQTNALSRLDDSNPRVQSDAEMSIVRCHEALVRSSERLARLFGMDAPQRIIEEQYRASVVKTDNTFTIVWPEFKDDGRPVPGLDIRAAPALLEAAARRNGDGSDKVTDAQSNAPVSDSGTQGNGTGDRGLGV